MWCFECDEYVEEETVPVELDEGEIRYVAACPVCGSKHVIPADLCGCGEWKPVTYRACPYCRDIFTTMVLPGIKELTARGCDDEAIFDMVEEAL